MSTAVAFAFIAIAVLISWSPPFIMNVPVIDVPLKIKLIIYGVIAIFPLFIVVGFAVVIDVDAKILIFVKFDNVNGHRVKLLFKIGQVILLQVVMNWL